MPSKPDQRRSAGWSGNWSLLRDVEIVCAVVLERKTTGAAERLGISQSAVSRAIGKIEERLQKKLFHREGGRLTPTADALMLYQQGNSVFEALAGLEGNQPPPAEQVVVLAPPTLSHLYLAREIAHFVRAHPGIMVSLDVVTIEELPGWIAERRGDVGFTDTMFLHSGVTIESFIETSGICVLPPEHPLAKRQVISPRDLDNMDYVAIHRRHSLRGALDKIFAEYGTVPKITVETGGAVLAAELIQEGLGVSVLNPFPLVLSGLKDLVYRRFEADLPFRTNFLLPANVVPSVSTQIFLDFMKERRLALRETLAKYV